MAVAFVLSRQACAFQKAILLCPTLARTQHKASRYLAQDPSLFLLGTSPSKRRRLAALGTAAAAIRAAMTALNDFDAACADEATELLRHTAAAGRCGDGAAVEVLDLVDNALTWPDAQVRVCCVSCEIEIVCQHSCGAA